MSSPVLATNGGSTTNRKWVPEVNLGTVAAPNFQPVEFVNAFTPVTDSPNLVDSTIFADGGYSSQDKTGAAWSASMDVFRYVVANSSPPAYGTVQEFLRLKAIGQFGAANKIQMRFYEFDINDVAGLITPRVEAYVGFSTVSWAEKGGAQADEDMVTISCEGKGKLAIVAHPYPIGPVAPTVTVLQGNPLAAAGGTAFRLSGSAFTGTTGVTVGGVAATSVKVWSDNEITAVAGAHAAGSGLPVVVTNPTGSSTPVNIATYV